MPAIQPARLKIQAAQLAEQFGQPAAFVRGLHTLLDFYANRIYRPGQSGKPAPLLAAYNVPPPVLRQIAQENTPRARQDLGAALNLCQALWKEPFLEFRQLAAILLGQAPPAPPAPLLERLEEWIHTVPEERLLSTLLENGLIRLRLETPEALLQLIAGWLGAHEALSRQAGLRALLPLLADDSFQNLPAIFRLVGPYLRNTPAVVRPDVLNVLSALARRSPQETAFVLRESLATADNADSAWLTRQILNEFPPSQQESLRLALRPAKSA